MTTNRPRWPTRGCLWSVIGVLLGSAGGFVCALIWFRLDVDIRPAADPIDNWARGITQLVAALTAAGIGAVIGGIIAVIFGNRLPPDSPKEGIP